MLSLCFATLIIANITAIGLFFLTCLVGFCFGLPLTLIIDTYKKPKRINRTRSRQKSPIITYWDYLIVVLPAWLILIVIFANDYNSRVISLIILGLGYSVLILSPYNRRIDNLKIAGMLFLVSCSLFLIAIGIKFFVNSSFSRIEEIKLLEAPIIAYLYLIASRELIKRLFGTYPITLDRYFGPNNDYPLYNRKTNYWDMLWSMFNMIFAVIIVFALVW